MADSGGNSITLQEAYQRAQAALQAGDPEGALWRCQHLLRYYPRYLDAYRLLGETYLERGQADEALRLFNHVLNADPQNVLAHVGRGIIAEERGQIDQAIDEYERAFEIDPGITELRTELLRLYTTRYGSAGASVRTTPSGLAYVHLRSGLREAAISELSRVAQMRPDRWDVEVALAEALWRNEQLDEAAAVAGDILAGHPSCVKCNWLLGYIHWINGRIDSGRHYFLEAVALDPTYAIARRLWEVTPWPLDPMLIRTQPALIPTLPATGPPHLDLGATLQTQDLTQTPGAAAAARLAAAAPAPPAPPLPVPRLPTRSPAAGDADPQTLPFGLNIPKPPAAPQTAPLDPAVTSGRGKAAPQTAPLLGPGFPEQDAAPVTQEILLPRPPAPPAATERRASTAPLDLDWFDDWATATAGSPPPPPAAASPPAPASASPAPRPGAGPGVPRTALTPLDTGEPVLDAGGEPPPASRAPGAEDSTPPDWIINAPPTPEFDGALLLPSAPPPPAWSSTAPALPAAPVPEAADDRPAAVEPAGASTPGAAAPSPESTIAGLSPDSLIDWLSSTQAGMEIPAEAAALPAGALPPSGLDAPPAAPAAPASPDPAGPPAPADLSSDSLIDWLSESGPAALRPPDRPPEVAAAAPSPDPSVADQGPDAQQTPRDEDGAPEHAGRADPVAELSTPTPDRPALPPALSSPAPPPRWEDATTHRSLLPLPSWLTGEDDDLVAPLPAPPPQLPGAEAEPPAEDLPDWLRRAPAEAAGKVDLALPGPTAIEPSGSRAWAMALPSWMTGLPITEPTGGAAGPGPPDQEAVAEDQPIESELPISESPANASAAARADLPAPEPLADAIHTSAPDGRTESAMPGAPEDSRASALPRAVEQLSEDQLLDWLSDSSAGRASDEAPPPPAESPIPSGEVPAAPAARMAEADDLTDRSLLDWPAAPSADEGADAPDLQAVLPSVASAQEQGPADALAAGAAPPTEPAALPVAPSADLEPLPARDSAAATRPDWLTGTPALAPILGPDGEIAASPAPSDSRDLFPLPDWRTAAPASRTETPPVADLPDGADPPAAWGSPAESTGAPPAPLPLPDWRTAGPLEAAASPDAAPLAGSDAPAMIPDRPPPAPAESPAPTGPDLAAAGPPAAGKTLALAEGDRPGDLDPLHNPAQVGYNYSVDRRPAETSESDPVRDVAAEDEPFASDGSAKEDLMAPSYKEDDDQERQFDFDWDRDELPDYMKGFLMDEKAGPQAAGPPAPTAAPPVPAADPPGGLPSWLGNAEAAGQDFGPVQPFDFGAAAAPPPPAIRPLPSAAAAVTPVGGQPFGTPPTTTPPSDFSEADFAGLQPFDFGAAEGGGDFDLNSNTLPAWMATSPPAPEPAFGTGLGVPAAAERTPDPDLSNPGLPDWLRAPADDSLEAAPPAGGGDFDMNSNTLPAWLGAGGDTPPAGGGGVQPFAFGGPAPGSELPAPGGADEDDFLNFLSGGQAAGTGAPADFGPVQPFDFGTPTPPAPAGGAPPFDFGAPAPPAPAGGAPPFDFGALAPPTPSGAGSFDLGSVQPFDFGAGATPPPPAGAGGGFDFGAGPDVQPFDFTSGASTPPPGEGAPFNFGSPAPTGGFGGFDFGGAAPAAAPAPTGGNDFAFGGGGPAIQPFAREGLDAGATAPLVPPSMPGLGGLPGTPPGSPFPAPAGLGGFDIGAPAARPAPSSRLPSDPGLEDMTGLAGEEFSFEPFMFDQGGGTASPPPLPPPVPAPPPVYPRATGGGRPGEPALPPGLEDLPDLQPFSFDTAEPTGGPADLFEPMEQRPAFGRRATDRSESGRPAIPFNLDEEPGPVAGDVHGFSWQRPSGGSRPATPVAPEADTGGSIFAKARKRKEELEQSLRREAEARGETYSTARMNPPTDELDAAAYWPELDDDGNPITPAATPPAAPAPLFDLRAATAPSEADVAQDMAGLQLAPFNFNEEAGGAGAPVPFSFDQAGSPTPAPFRFGDPGAPPAPFSFGETGGAETPAPFSFGETGGAGTPAPFSFGETGGAETPAPFSFDETGGAETPAPFSFDDASRSFRPDEESGSAPVPFSSEETASAAGVTLGPPFSFDETASAVLAEPVTPFTFDMQSAAVPAAPEVAPAPEPAPIPVEAPPAELLWSIPVGEAPAAPDLGPSQGLGEEVAPGEFDFSGMQPFKLDLSGLGLSAEEQAYLMGGEDMGAMGGMEGMGEVPPVPEMTTAAAPAPVVVEPSATDEIGIPEIAPIQEAEPALAEPLQPFSFDAAQFESATAPALPPFAPEPELAPAAAPPAPVEPLVPVFPDEPPAEFTPYGSTPSSEVSPLAAESWSEVPAGGVFDFSQVHMEPLEPLAPEPAPAAEPEPEPAPAVAVPETPAPPVYTAPPPAPGAVPTVPAMPAAVAPPAARELTPHRVPAIPPPVRTPARPPAVVPEPEGPPPPLPPGASIDDLVSHLSTYPSDAAARLALAIGYEQRGDYSRATEQYRQLIKGRNVPTSLLEVITGNLRDLVESQPDNPAMHRLLGDAYMKQGQFQMAISQYNWLLTKGGHPNS